MRSLPLWCLALVAGLGLSCVEDPTQATTRTAPWEAFRFRAVKSARSRSCNLELTTPTLDTAEAELRVLLEVQPGNEDYYGVSVTRDRLVLGKVECGVEMALASWDEPGAFSQGHRLVIMRRPGSIGVAVGNRKVIEVADDSFTQGRVAIGAVGVADVPEVKVQSTGEIFAFDDFMRTNEDAADWVEVQGDWAVEFLKNPGLSANAFLYAGMGGEKTPGITLLGEPWWDNYSYEASVKPAGQGGFGLMIRFIDEQNYYLFRSATTPAGGRLQMVRLVDGVETVLDEQANAMEPGQWYRMSVTAHGSRLIARVDGHTVHDLRDEQMAFGRAGLYVGPKVGAEFDDVFLRGERGLYDDFSGDQTAWLPKGGRWAVEQAEGSRSVLKAVGPGGADAIDSGKLIGGEDTWEDYRISTTLEPGARGTSGVVVRYRGEQHFDEFAYDTEQREYRLTEVRDGVRRVVGRTPAKNTSAVRDVAVKLARDVLFCQVNGTTVLSHFDPGGKPGKAGLMIGKNSQARFASVQVDFPREIEPVLTQLDTFARESTMRNWAAAESDWQERQTRLSGETRSIHWHRAAFPGSGELVASGFFDPTKKGKLHLCTGWDLTESGSGALSGDSGYELIAYTTTMDESSGRIELKRNGEVVADSETPALRGVNRVALRRMMEYVVGELNGKVVLAYKDSAPLEGWRSGYAADAVLVKPEEISVFCPNTVSYSFVRSPSDWRFAGSEWMVTNRWRCDPRWSFFGGENMQGAAAIWNKTEFSGDITLEFAAGIRHQQTRGGYQSHVSDMNAVLCGDGEDLNTGYGFIFGGWGNTKTAITRNGSIVKEIPNKIPAGGNIHRRWFYIKIVKRQGHLRYFIDNKLILEYTDPEPLTGGHIALWTWKNGLMVARVRIAAEHVGARMRHDAAFKPVAPAFYNN